MSETKRYAAALAAMLFAASMQWLSLAIFDNLAISFFLYTVLACLCVPALDLVFRLKARPADLPRAISLAPARLKPVLFAFLLGLAMDAIMVAAFLLLGSLFLREGRALDVVGSWGIKPGPSSALYFLALALNGGVEELFWRGYIHRLLEDSPKRVLAVSLPALVFGGQHFFVISRLVPNPPSVALFIFAITASGLLWGVIREKAKSLLPCVVCHMVVAVGYLGILGSYLFGA